MVLWQCLVRNMVMWYVLLMCQVFLWSYVSATPRSAGAFCSASLRLRGPQGAPAWSLSMPTAFPPSVS